MRGDPPIYTLVENINRILFCVLIIILLIIMIDNLDIIIIKKYYIDNVVNIANIIFSFIFYTMIIFLGMYLN